MRKPPSLPHVKYVRRGERLYAYFNTGTKRDGKTVYAAMPHPGSAGFHSSYAAFLAGRTKRKTKAYTVADLTEEYRRSSELAGKADNTQRLYRAQMKHIVEHWGAFPANDLTPADVRLVLDNEGWNAGTQNMVTAVLGVVFRWGRQRGKTAQQPTKDVERSKGGEHAPWPEDVLEAALSCDDPAIRLAVSLLYFTGLRIGDALALRWGDVRGNVIHVTPQKTRRYRKHLRIPVHAELRTALDQAQRTGITILHGHDQRRLRIALQAFTRGHGVETVPHGLRKNAVIALLEAGCTVPEVAAITGQTFQVVEHYAARVNNDRLGATAIIKFEAKRRAE